MNGRFQQKEDEHLVRTPPSGRRQIFNVEVPAVKNDGVAVVQQSSISRRQAATRRDNISSSYLARSEWLAAQTNLEIVGPKEFRPVENK